jgi:hypothetical protein
MESFPYYSKTTVEEEKEGERNECHVNPPAVLPNGALHRNPKKIEEE